MKKVAIVGVEGSGKTVMLAGLGDLYLHPDKNGFFLSPKNFTTASYVSEKVAKMRAGAWPVATAEDVMQGLYWMLKRKMAKGAPVTCCEVSFLDFPGEVYRSVFGVREDLTTEPKEGEGKALWDYVKQADDVIVLVNLKDVISKGPHDPRVQETVWITKRILDFALSTDDGRKASNAAIVLSQTDSYAATIRECGGAKGILEKYLPYVSGDYGWLDVLTVCSVDKTRIDDDGNVLPGEGFTFEGLRPIMDRIISDKVGDGQFSEYQTFRMIGTAALVGGAVGVAFFGFSSWLGLWDLLHFSATTLSNQHEIAEGLSLNLVFGLSAAIIAFVGFLFSVCVKPGRRSLSLWRNRFTLGMLTFGFALTATLFGEFATFDGGSDRKALEKKYAPCLQDNIIGCVLTSMGALVFGSLLAFGCDTGRRVPVRRDGTGGRKDKSSRSDPVKARPVAKDTRSALPSYSPYASWKYRSYYNREMLCLVTERPGIVQIPYPRHAKCEKGEQLMKFVCAGERVNLLAPQAGNYRIEVIHDQKVNANRVLAVLLD